MSNQLFVITVGFLLSSFWLINSQPFDCGQGVINVALVYDCRYSIQLQQDFFTQFIQVFEPLQPMVSNNTTSVVKSDINLILMTYTESKLKIFEKLTQENFTLDEFNESTFNLNTSSCPQHLPLKTVFNDTREALGGYSGNVRKLAVFVLAENLTDYENDDKELHGLEFQQGLNAGVKRVFILIKTQTELKEKGRYSLYTSTLNNSLEIVKKNIGIICNACHKHFKGFKHGTSCYYLTEVLNEQTAGDADEICQQKWPGSHLAYINSQSELKYLMSYVVRTKYNFDRLHDYMKRHPEDWWTRQIPITNIQNYGFVGLSSRKTNNTEDYTWNDGTPLVVDFPWGSRSKGKVCVYMSMTYFILFDITDGKHFQWNDIDCNIPKQTDFLLCESDMSDVRKLLLDLKEFKPKKQKYYFHLLYTSYSHLLFNHINNELKNNVMSLMKQKLSFSVIQKVFTINCNESEESRKKDSSTHITQINLFIEIIQRKRPNCKIKIIDNDSALFNDDSYIYEGVRYNEQHSKFLSKSHFDVKYLIDVHQIVQNCMYEIDSKRLRVGIPNNSNLLDCERFVCPPGFVKCPESYCIPVYLVDDGVKDCPHGEDEVSINYATKLCTGQFIFTIRNFCLLKDICDGNGQCLNRNNVFVCKVPCETGYACVSNILRKENSNHTTFYLSFVKTAVNIYEDLGVFTFTPQIYSLFQLFKLVQVDLSNCRIRDLENVFESLDSLDVIILDVSQNFISGHNFSVIQEMKNLQKLNMSFNKNLKLDEKFIFPVHLQVLDMSHTQSGSLVLKNLINFTHLKVLKLRNVEPIDLSLTENVNLDILDVRGTELINLKDGYLRWLSIQRALYSDDFRTCCQVIRGPNIPENKCHAPRDAISTCQDLIGDPQKRVILWVVGILSLLGNILVVIYRIIWDRSVFNNAYGLFVVCLAVSDFIMGVYLMIIAGADLLYRNMYVLEDSNWRYSNICKLAGILSTFSSETSTMFICLITLDRYFVIKYPFGEHRFSQIGKIFSVCLTLIIGVVVSVIPVLFPSWEIYSSNGMCLALPFSSGRHTGWEYSAMLFVGLNFFLFIFIAIGQIAIFRAVTSYEHKSFSSTMNRLRKSQDRAVAKQLFLVALSDFCCWFPIGVMGIMSLSGFQFNLDVYAWSAVLVLPINSAINPLIYTVPVILRKIISSNLFSKFTLRN